MFYTPAGFARLKSGFLKLFDNIRTNVRKIQRGQSNGSALFLYSCI